MVTTTAELAESDTSSASSSVSNVSSQTTYEESASWNCTYYKNHKEVILVQEDAQYQQAMIMYNESKRDVK